MARDRARSAWKRAFKGIYTPADLRALGHGALAEGGRQRRRARGERVPGRRGQSAG